MNKVILIGRLTKDPAMNTTSNTTVCKFNVAIDRAYKKDGEQSADFISCVAFGKTAEFIGKYFTKGSKIVIEGEWRTGSYTNKDGQKVYTNDCVVNRVEFGESKKAESAPSAPDDDFMNIPGDIDEQIPFV
ncbi:MAG: single-stranded DNA-binding protein [Aeriscardovia sp.]|nr:single-stranded DNA-binding protein [Aeriscardovia sp.]MBR6843443.1 single-stranded DNA-binding protein [Prevotella sp.]